VVKEFGADVLRMYEMFMGPLEAVKPWQTSQLAGVVRFRDRVFNAVTSSGVSEAAPEGDVLREMHKTIKKVTRDIDNMAFNTAISTLMIYVNTLNSAVPQGSPKPRQAVEALVLLLSPFAPHLAEEAWQQLGHTESISRHPWPTFDAALCVETVATIAVQVNGKVRGKLEIEKDLAEKDAMELAMSQASVKKYTDGLEIKKVVYVPGRILSIITGK
jgi:leucyl-tRNA synthetase